ncbi:MAG: hypothetical protein ACYC8T_20220 [Myxococcaceae bacterium]
MRGYSLSVREPDLVESHRLGPAARPRRETPGAKLRVSLELFEAGVAMMRARLRQRHPQASGRTIERMLVEWLGDKPPHDFGSTKAWRNRPKPH